MIYNYSQFINQPINEGSTANPEFIYWNSQMEKLWDKHWSNISIDRYSDYYFLKFKVNGLETKDDKYTYYAALLDTNKGESFMMEQDISEKFMEKFKEEFWNNPANYIENMKYKPKFLGDLTGIKRGIKTNLWSLK